MMTNAESNVAELLSAAGPDTNVVVNGQLVQGTMSPMMSKMLEWRRRFRELPEDVSEEDIDVLTADMRFELTARAA